MKQVCASMFILLFVIGLFVLFVGAWAKLRKMLKSGTKENDEKED